MMKDGKHKIRVENPRYILLDHFISGPNIALKIFLSSFHFGQALLTFVAFSVFNSLDLRLDFIWPPSKLPLPFIERGCHCPSSREIAIVIRREKVLVSFVERDYHCRSWRGTVITIICCPKIFFVPIAVQSFLLLLPKKGCYKNKK